MKLLIIEVVRYGDYFESRYQRIRDLGYDVHVLFGVGNTQDRDPSRYRSAGGQQLPDIVAAAQAWHHQAHFDGITTIAETSIVATAHTAATLALPYPEPEAALASRNKFLMRQAHAAHHVPHPDFHLIQALSDIDAWPDRFPAIVKPTLGSASSMVFKVHNKEELRRRALDVLTHLSELPIFQLEATGVDLGPNAVLVEAFLEEHEHLLEGHVRDGRFEIGSIVDRITLEGDTFDDDVHHAPTELLDSQRREMLAVAEAAVRAQGLDNCTTHVEIRFAEGKPYVIEAAARPGGGSLDLMAKHSYGYDPLAALSQLATTGSTDQVSSDTQEHTVACCLLSPPGRVVSIEGAEVVAGNPDVYFFKLSVEVGSVVRRPPQGNDIAGFLGVRGATFYATKQLLQAVEQDIRIVTEETQP